MLFYLTDRASIRFQVVDLEKYCFGMLCGIVKNVKVTERENIRPSAITATKYFFSCILLSKLVLIKGYEYALGAITLIIYRYLKVIL